jgi:hypothetical protein
LTNLTKGKGTNKFFRWGPLQEESFELLKHEFEPGKVLVHFNPDLQIYVFADASRFSASGIMCQPDQHNCLRPVFIWSKKFSTSETKYPTSDQELLAIVWAMERLITKVNSCPVSTQRI